MRRAVSAVLAHRRCHLDRKMQVQVEGVIGAENAIGQSDLVADFAGNVEQKATHDVRPAGRES